MYVRTEPPNGVTDENCRFSREKRLQTLTFSFVRRVVSNPSRFLSQFLSSHSLDQPVLLICSLLTTYFEINNPSPTGSGFGGPGRLQASTSKLV
jgi:hypothetical protein